ncbi:MAG TPA: hypothetical protein VFI28_13590 [Candidatus Limnocylindrales bacterium]|nr:hypothetical protein [Candidatus Limnocylindrales bacterium]
MLRRWIESYATWTAVEIDAGGWPEEDIDVSPPTDIDVSPPTERTPMILPVTGDRVYLVIHDGSTT